MAKGKKGKEGPEGWRDRERGRGGEVQNDEF